MINNPLFQLFPRPEPADYPNTTARGSSMENSTVENSTGKQLFPDLAGGESEREVTEMESLCLRCYKQGTTKLLLTRIPHFKEVVISSFSCEHCGHRNSGIESAGRVQETGVKYTLSVCRKQDLNRQVVKSDSATFSIPHLEFEQPPTDSKKGEVTTVEGLITSAVEGLLYYQPQRREADPSTAAKIDDFILKLKKLTEVDTAFDVVLDDTSGNSFIENPLAPARDEGLAVHHYRRTAEQNIALGLQVEEDGGEGVGQPGSGPESQGDQADSTDDKTDLKQEVLQFQNNCPNCSAPCSVNMKLVDIPFFKEVVIMATNCERCGLRDNEVKSGSGVEDKGTRINLKLTDPSDLNRDVLKSDTCALSIPELELELQHGTLGGRFTTIEGLLKQVKDQLSSWNPFVLGDSATGDMKEKLAAFVTKLDQVMNAEMMGVHVVLDDPAGNSYIQNVYAPDPDPEMSVVHYDRDFEQNELLGLNDMKTENYDSSAATK